MDSDDILIFLLIFLFVVIVTVFSISNKRRECYEDYIEQGIIPKSCEKYFKDLKIGDVKDEKE